LADKALTASVITAMPCRIAFSAESSSDDSFPLVRFLSGGGTSLPYLPGMLGFGPSPDWTCELEALDGGVVRVGSQVAEEGRWGLLVEQSESERGGLADELMAFRGYVCGSTEHGEGKDGPWEGSGQWRVGALV